MKCIYMTLALLATMLTGAYAQQVDLEAILQMNEGTSLVPTRFLSPQNPPQGDSTYGVWGIVNNGPEDMRTGDIFSMVSSFNRFVNPSDSAFNDSLKYYFYSQVNLPADVSEVPAFIYGPYSYDSIGRIGLLYDWKLWKDSNTVRLLGLPYDTFQACQEYGMFVRVWGMGTDPQIPQNDDSDTTNNRAVVRVKWDCGDNTTGLPTIMPKEKLNLTVYPNPAVDNLSFDFTFTENTHVETIVRDISGRKVAGKNYGHILASTKTFNVDVSKLPPGIYTVELSADELSATSKFSIQK